MAYRVKKNLGCPHVKCLSDCRKARPRCRNMRAKSLKYELCECGAYHFPHRKGSGLCRNQMRLWLIVFGLEKMVG